MSWFKKEDPKELAKQAKRDTRREVRVSPFCLDSTVPCRAVRSDLLVFVLLSPANTSFSLCVYVSVGRSVCRSVCLCVSACFFLCALDDMIHIIINATTIRINISPINAI